MDQLTLLHNNNKAKQAKYVCLGLLVHSLILLLGQQISHAFSTKKKVGERATSLYTLIRVYVVGSKASSF